MNVDTTPPAPEEIARDVCDAIGLDHPPAPDDDLFEHGLDSLSVIKMAAGWRRRGADVTFDQLADEPTLRAWQGMLARPSDLRG